MSLKWNIEKCDDHDNLNAEAASVRDDGVYTASASNITEAIVWAFLCVDMSGIRTEEDVDEMLWRLHFLHASGRYRASIPAHRPASGDVELGGAGMWRDSAGEVATTFDDSFDGWWIRDHRMPSREDLTRRLGMTTNVTRVARSTFVTRTKAQIVKEWSSAADRAVSRAVQEMTR
jgi:hypothetical protein